MWREARGSGDHEPSTAVREPLLAEALQWAIVKLDRLLPPEEPHTEERPPWGAHAGGDPVLYRYWLAERAALDGRDETDAPEGGCLVSVVVPVYRPVIRFFLDCVAAVRAQTYANWELCLCDDGSGDPELSRVLQELATSDRRITFTVHEHNLGISNATNTALSLATGEWVALVDHDDLLAPHALSEVVKALAQKPEADVVYTDDDRMDEQGRRYDPFFKPDWAPELLLSHPYMNHLTLIRRTLLESIGGFRPEFDGSQDFDVMLRATERARAVVHVPQILYHWRAVAGSAAGGGMAKPWAHQASRRAVEDTVRRRGIDGVVDDTRYTGAYHVRRRIAEHPSVAVIVPLRDQARLTAKCLTSIGLAPGYPHYQVVLVDNASSEPETHAFLDRARRQGVRVVDYPGTFNWSAINNVAAASCDADLLLFMNNDIEAKSDGWLHALVELAQLPTVGAVGARLMAPDGTLQHAGIFLGSSTVTGHIFFGMPPDELGYSLWEQVVRPYSAVTGACLMTSRRLFEQVGGFDERLHTAFNDVDYCLRLNDAGYQVLYTPHAELMHDESATRGMSGFVADVRHFLAKWDRDRLGSDPFYNPNLGRFGTWCPLRQPDEDERWDRLMDDLAGVPRR